MKIRDRMRKTIEYYKMLPEGAHIVLGLSGGPDSVCLLTLLAEESREKDLWIYPIHINHQLRGEDADRDQAYAEGLAESLGLSLSVYSFDCRAYAEEQGISTEEAGRIVRYREFCRLAKEVEASGVPNEKIVITVAHNMDDQAETILFRIARGTGIDGLSGIPHVRRNGEYPVVRPILDVKRSEIEAYLEEKRIQPAIDATNLEPVYTRNRIRLSVLPELEKVNPGVRENLARLGMLAGEESEYLNRISAGVLEEALIEESEGSILFDGNRLRAADSVIVKRAVRLALEKLTGNLRDVSYLHLEEAEKILRTDSPSAETSLPGGIVIGRVYENLRISVPCGKEDAECRYTVAVLSREEYIKRKPSGCMEAAFDYTLLGKAYGASPEKKIVQRTRREGDRIAIKGGSRKIQDLFVDRKVPKSERGGVILYAIGRDVLFVPGGKAFGKSSRYAEGLKFTQNTPKVLLITHNC